MKAVVNRFLVLSALVCAACSRVDDREADWPQGDPGFVESRHQAQLRLDYRDSLDSRLATLDERLEEVRDRRGSSPTDPTLAELSDKRDKLAIAADRVLYSTEATFGESSTDFENRYQLLSDRLDRENQDYKDDAPRRLREIDERIDDVRRRRAGAPDATLTAINEKRGELAIAAHHLKNASQDSWKEAASGFEKSYRELLASLELERVDYSASITTRYGELEQRLNALLDTPRYKTDKARAELEAKKSELSASADRVKSATQATWKDATNDFEQKYARLKERIDRESGAKGK